jgi:dephospho-CoA kinase
MIVGIFGKIGSGKSSFLMSMLEQINFYEGNL